MRGEGGDADDRSCRRRAREAARERLVGEVEDTAVARDHEIAVAVADETVHRLVQMRSAHRSAERRVEREHPAVTRNEPVPAVVGRRCDADDRAVQVHVSRRTVEVGVAEGEDAAVASDHEVTVTGRGRHRRDDRTVQGRARHVAIGACVAVREHARRGS